MNRKRKQVVQEVNQLLEQNQPEEAMKLIYDNFIAEPVPSKYLVCPRCGGRMRSDNETGLCGKCQRQLQPNSRNRDKKNDKNLD